MLAIRSLLAQRHFALLLCAAALFLKLLVPSGYMLSGEQGRLSVIVCSGVQVHASDPTTASGMHHAMPGHRAPAEHGKAEMPCAFTGLSAAALGAIAPIQLAADTPFVLAVGIARAMAPMPAASPYLRPPLRGPPASS